MMRVATLLVGLATLSLEGTCVTTDNSSFHEAPPTRGKETIHRITEHMNYLKSNKNEILPHTEENSFTPRLQTRRERSLPQTSSQVPPPVANAKFIKRLCRSERLNCMDTMLLEAASLGDVATIQRFLAHDANATSFIRTALHVAVYAGQLAAVRALIDSGVNASAQTRYGNTPLHYAAASGHLDIARLLVAAGANVSPVNRLGRSPLHEAAANNHRNVVKFLLEKGAVVCPSALKDAASFWRRFTPLKEAAQAGHAGAVEELLSACADIEAQRDMEETALAWAARAGRNNVVRFLLARGADVNATWSDGRTALHGAAIGGHDEVVGTLLEAGADVRARDTAGVRPLMLASFGGHESTTRDLLARGAVVSARTLKGETALHWALKIKRRNGKAITVCQVLVEGGADVVARDNKGITPLMRAADVGYAGVVGMLLLHGAPVNVRTVEAETALHWAGRCQNESASVVRSLLGAGAEVEAADKRGRTPLMVAAGRGNLQAVRVLLAHGADVRAKDGMGRTALHWATFLGVYCCQRTHLEARNGTIVGMLLEHGADVGAKDGRGRTALHWAAMGGSASAVQSLLDAGADAAARDDEGKTALSYARSGDVRLALENRRQR